MTKLILALVLVLLSPLSAFAGRFELVQLGQMRADQYLLDTQTGRVWRSVCAHEDLGKCEYSIWEPSDVVGISITAAQAYKRIESKMKAAGLPQTKE